MLVRVLLILAAAICCGRINGRNLRSSSKTYSSTHFQDYQSCKGYRCPKYSVLNETRLYEVRRYPSSKYIVAREEGLNFTEARRNNFRKLHNYLSGSNSQKSKIQKSHPIYNRFVIGGNGKVGNLYAMIVYLPQEYHSNPPIPNASDVEIVDFDESEAIVHSFNGFASESKILQQHKQLKNSLHYTDLDYDPVVFYSAEYNEPWQYFNQYNEMVFIKMNPTATMKSSRK